MKNVLNDLAPGFFRSFVLPGYFVVGISPTAWNRSWSGRWGVVGGGWDNWWQKGCEAGRRKACPILESCALWTPDRMWRKKAFSFLAFRSLKQYLHTNMHLKRFCCRQKDPFFRPASSIWLAFIQTEKNRNLPHLTQDGFRRFFYAFLIPGLSPGALPRGWSQSQ